MNRLTARGAGIIMISSELPELLGMSDRVLVMHRGRIQAELAREEATEERVLSAALWILTPHFLTTSNLINVVEQTSINAIVAVGMTFVILSAGIDLSVGSIVALAGVILGVALRDGQPLAFALMLTLAVGVVCGAVNGLLVSHGGLPPFIVTLGTM